MYLLVALAGVLLAGCVHPLVPLENAPPSIVSTADTLTANLIYPDSAVGLLVVVDNNDTRIMIDSAWPGMWVQNTFDYGAKTVSLFASGTTMGHVSGTLHIRDQAGSVDSIPYSFIRSYIDSFETRLPKSCWVLYNPSDTGSFLQSYTFSTTDAVMRYLFTRDIQHSTSTTCGVRSAFTLASPLTCSVELTLRAGMVDGFETSFYISTSSDTGRYSGDVAGVFISGHNQEIQIKCKSASGQISLQSRPYLQGKLSISYATDRIIYLYQDYRQTSLDTIAAQNFVADTALFVHMRMNVADRNTERDCFWNNFIVSQGAITF